MPHWIEVEVVVWIDSIEAQMNFHSINRLSEDALKESYRENQLPVRETADPVERIILALCPVVSPGRRLEFMYQCISVSTE